MDGPFINNFFLGDKWANRRRQLTPAFHFSILNNMIDNIGRNSEILIEKLANEVDSDQFDIMPYLSSCTLDIICGNYNNSIKSVHFTHS